MKYTIQDVANITTQSRTRCLGIWSRWLQLVKHKILTRYRALRLTFILYHQRATQRRALALLDERLLQDINISREDAQREARKPFWRP